MGEIAEMMLDGTLCEGCGVYLDRSPQGYPGYCSRECAVGRGAVFQSEARPVGKPVGCPSCTKRFRTHDAYLQHWRDKHDAPKVPDQPST